VTYNPSVLSLTVAEDEEESVGDGGDEYAHCHVYYGVDDGEDD
jgi:hypothetical protein